ncbi:MAG: hypothetical protein OXK80_01155 [Bdellovibrionales bacterium]|nr:hypothetical protein [Bdellovibrionales bacterium]
MQRKDLIEGFKNLIFLLFIGGCCTLCIHVISDSENSSEFLEVREAERKEKADEISTSTRSNLVITRETWPELLSHINELMVNCNNVDQNGLPLGRIGLFKTTTKKEVINRPLTGESFVVDTEDIKLTYVNVHFQNYLGMGRRETFLGGTKSVVYEPITKFVDTKKVNLKEIQSRIKKKCKVK